MLFMTGRLPTIFPRTLGDMGEVDEDVAREAERVRIGGAATDVVRVSSSTSDVFDGLCIGIRR